MKSEMKLISKMNSFLEMKTQISVEMNSDLSLKMKMEMKTNLEMKLEMNSDLEMKTNLEMNFNLEMNSNGGLEMNLDYVKTPTNNHNLCALPLPRHAYLVCWDIIEKLEDLGDEHILADILRNICVNFAEVQEYIKDNHIDVLMEEDL